MYLICVIVITHDYTKTHMIHMKIFKLKLLNIFFKKFFLYLSRI